MKEKKFRTVLKCATAILVLAIILFFSCFQITSVKVTGNQHYTEDEIKKMVLTGPLAKHSILVMLLNPDEKTKDAEFIQKIKLVRTSRNSVEIRVKEKKLIGCVKYLDGYLYFDREGIVRISSLELMEDIPFIEGVSFSYVRLDEKLPDLKEEKLNLILSVTKMLDKGGQVPNRLVLNDKQELVLHYGNVEVRLGTDMNMEEKMNRLLGILPSLEGMSGILHLENVTQDSRTVSFESSSPTAPDAVIPPEGQTDNGDAGENGNVSLEDGYQGEGSASQIE